MIEQIRIIRSKRKTIAVEIKKDLSVVVRAPIGLSQTRIERFIADKTVWIERHLEIMKKRSQESSQNPQSLPFTDDELTALKRKAKQYIPQRVNVLASQMGVKYNGIALRFQSSRWGSCSAKGNLNFNCLLMLCTVEIIDYVLIHELCHLRYMNHSKSFWELVSKYCPNYMVYRKSLKHNGKAMIERLNASK